MDGGREHLNAVLQRLGGKPLPPDSIAVPLLPDFRPRERSTWEMQNSYT